MNYTHKCGVVKVCECPSNVVIVLFDQESFRVFISSDICHVGIQGETRRCDRCEYHTVGGHVYSEVRSVAGVCDISAYFHESVELDREI